MPYQIFEPDFLAFKNASNGKENGVTKKRTKLPPQKLKKDRYIKIKPSGGTACTIISETSTTGSKSIEKLRSQETNNIIKKVLKIFIYKLIN